jgi:hypothetical protein
MSNVVVVLIFCRLILADGKKNDDGAFFSLSFPQSVRLFICLSVFLSVWLPFYLSARLFMSVCMPFYMSVCLSIYLFLTFYMSFCLSIYIFICMTFYLSFCLSAWVSICLSAWVSICLSACLSFYLPVYLFIYLSDYVPASFSCSPSSALAPFFVYFFHFGVFLKFFLRLPQHTFTITSKDWGPQHYLT